MKQVTFLLLGILLMGSSHDCISQTPITDANIHEAVDLWVSNPTIAEATYGHISDWDTSSVTDMSRLFESKELFNEDISHWDVSSVTNMNRMFFDAWSFNKPIGEWDVSSVTDMSWMFRCFTSPSNFNQPIGDWDVSSVTNMSFMFADADSFNQPIGNWDVSSVTDMSSMFNSEAFIIRPAFNQPIGGWDVSSVTNMRDMFRGDDETRTVFNQDISKWDVSSVTDMREMFSTSAFNQPIGDWEVGNVKKMIGMLYRAPFSTENYDNLLIGWAKRTLQSNVRFDAPQTSYCTGEEARALIIETYGWSIDDAGKDCSSALTPITDANIQEAVNLWVSDPNVAEEKYGHISNWDTSRVTDMSGLFEGKFLFNDDISTWDVSSVRDMSRMFRGGNWEESGEDGPTSFNQPIGNWDVSNVRDMSEMFAASAFRQPIGNWDVSGVINMSGMFHDARAFNQPIGDWDVSNVIDMNNMFHYARGFNQPIGNWDVSSVTDMSEMFRGLWDDDPMNFNQPIGNWDVSNVKNMSGMFASATYFNQSIENWDVSSVKNMSGMFLDATYFNKPIGNWDVSSVTNLSSMFHTALSFNQPIENWKLSKVTDMRYMFYDAIRFNQTIANWDVSNVTDMTDMFYYANSFSTENYDKLLIGWAKQVLQPNVSFGAGATRYCNGETARASIIETYGWTITDAGKDADCSLLTPITDTNIHEAVDLWFTNPTLAEDTFGHMSDWDTSKVTDMSALFYGRYLSSEDITNWDVSNVTNMASMFYNSSGSFNQPFGDWDVSNVTNMSWMFAETGYNKDITSWDVSNVTNMSYMFFGNHSFNQPIGNWNVSNVTTMAWMFADTQFNQDISSWDVSSVTNMDYFFPSSQFNQDISSWDVSRVTSMHGMLSNARAFSTENYDKLLISWAKRTLQPNVTFDAPETSYCTGEVSRNSIIENFSWTITDAGQGEDCIKKVNCLTVDDNIGFAGGTSDIYLNLKSTELIKGFQFDITFPDGFVFDPLDLTKTELPTNFQVTCAAIGGNAYRVIGFSLTNETIPCGKKSILSFPTFINEETLEDDYPIPVTNVILSDVDNLDITCHCPLDGVITVYNHPLGDANGDYDVNVLDILATIDYIFGNPPSPFYFDLADVNFDATIDVFDVLGIQDIILNPSSKTSSDKTKGSTASALSQSNYLIVDSQSLSPSSSETLAFNLSNNDVVKGLQFDFLLPEGITFNPKGIIGTSRLNGFTIKAQEVSKNTYKVIIFSLSSATITSGTGTILELPVFIDSEINNGVYPMAFTDVKISETNNINVATTPPNVGNITIGTLGVDTLEKAKDKIKVFPNPVKNLLHMSSELECDYQMYDLQGRYVGKGNVLIGNNQVDTSMLQSGLYMIKISTANSTVIMKFIKE